MAGLPNGKGANLTIAHPGGATFTLDLDKSEIKHLIDDLSAMI
jgi:hypothetical protein